MTDEDKRPETITVTPEIAREVVGELARKAPDGCRGLPVRTLGYMRRKRGNPGRGEG